MSNDNVVKLHPPDPHEDPDNVINESLGVFDEVLVLGYNKDGELEARASTNMQSRDILWLLETFKQVFLEQKLQGE